MLYIVTAHRWGWLNADMYHVWAGEDRSRARGTRTPRLKCLAAEASTAARCFSAPRPTMARCVSNASRTSPVHTLRTRPTTTRTSKCTSTWAARAGRCAAQQDLDPGSEEPEIRDVRRCRAAAVADRRSPALGRPRGRGRIEDERPAADSPLVKAPGATATVTAGTNRVLPLQTVWSRSSFEDEVRLPRPIGKRVEGRRTAPAPKFGARHTSSSLQPTCCGTGRSVAAFESSTAELPTRGRPTSTSLADILQDDVVGVMPPDRSHPPSQWGMQIRDNW